jgi:uncharacterized protein (TIGR02145 family)
MEENEIKIGDQTWTSKNLDVETYRNGDAIPQVEDQEEWANLTTGAWCYYENESDNGTTYGNLYNWYAVNDPRGLAPKGFHIPSDAEWTILTENLGYKAGTKMKSTSGWDDDGNGTNSSGFAGLPGGQRGHNGYFYHIGSSCHWWSSSESKADSAWSRYIYSVYGYLSTNANLERSGFSVRCLRD